MLGCYFVVYAGLLKSPHRWSRISESDFYRVHAGMTEQEVEKILGKPVDSFENGSKLWMLDGEGSITVEFDQQTGRVKRGEFQSGDPLPYKVRIPPKVEPSTSRSTYP